MFGTISSRASSRETLLTWEYLFKKSLREISILIQVSLSICPCFPDDLLAIFITWMNITTAVRIRRGKLNFVKARITYINGSGWTIRPDVNASRSIGSRTPASSLRRENLKPHSILEMAINNPRWATWNPGHTRLPAPNVKLERFVDSGLMELLSIAVKSALWREGSKSRGFFVYFSLLLRLHTFQAISTRFNPELALNLRGGGITHIHHQHCALGNEMSIVEVVFDHRVRNSGSKRGWHP